MWELATALVKNVEAINIFLKEDYEPFSVTADTWGQERIWLKRKIEEIKTYEVLNQQSKSVRKASKRAHPKSKAEEKH